MIFRTGENVAMGKSSLQSSTLWNYAPELAVDSDPDTCSFTPRSSEQRWWQVHLGDAINVQVPLNHFSTLQIKYVLSSYALQNLILFFILGCGNKHISRILSEIHHFHHRYAANDLSEKLHLVNTSKCTKNAAVQFAHEFIMIIKGSNFLRQIAYYWLPPLN